MAVNSDAADNEIKRSFIIERLTQFYDVVFFGSSWSWEQSLIAETSVEMNFAVARAFELFENYVVHARASVNERCRNDCQRAAFFDVARRAKESLRPLQGV